MEEWEEKKEVIDAKNWKIIGYHLKNWDIYEINLKNWKMNVLNLKNWNLKYWKVQFRTLED